MNIKILVCSFFLIAMTTTAFGQKIYVAATPHADLFSLKQNDSMQNQKVIRIQLGFEAGYSYRVQKDFWVSAGLRLDRTAFGLDWVAPNLYDTIHPDIGRVKDFAAASSKTVHATHQMTQIAIPLRAYKVVKQATDKKVGVSLSGGLTPAILIGKTEKYSLEGFTLDGEKEFELKGQGHEWRTVNVTAEVGLQLAVPFATDFHFLFEPGIKAPLASTTIEGFRNVTFYSHVGVIYSL